jgi:hypothetical protein
MSRQNVLRSEHAFNRDDAHDPDEALAAIPVRVSNSLTIAEASKRWCPFVRIREYAEGTMETTAVNRTFDSEDSAARGSLCLGANCMAWRWDITYAWDERERRSEPRGCCGLAGKPI